MPVIPFIPLIAAVAGPLLTSALAPKPSGLSPTAAADSVAAPAPAPAVTPPTTMPSQSPQDDAAKMARRKSLAEQVARKGRASTILTDGATDDPSSTLG